MMGQIVEAPGWPIHTSDHKNQKTRLFSLLALVVCVRVLFAFVIWLIKGPAGFFSPDTGYYVLLAQSMLHGSFSFAGIPEIFRTPVYPTLLIPGVAFHHVVIVALVENLLLSVMSAWLIWKIADNLFPESEARFWAVILYCFEPLGLLYSEKVLTETCFTTLLLLFFWIFLLYLRQPTYRNLILAALVLGAATYVRPVALYLALWLVPVLVLLPRSLPAMQRLARTVPF